MKKRTTIQIEAFFKEHENLMPLKEDIMHVCQLLLNVYEKGGKLLICGNGGSCADSDHMVGELMKGFLLKRPVNEKMKRIFKDLYGDEGIEIVEKLQGALPAISLNAHAALMSAFGNDVDASLVYAQQVFGYCEPKDAVIGISTSGNAENVAKALKTAHALGASTIAFSGRDGGKLKQIADYSIVVPKNETYQIQEVTLIIYHFICIFVESEIFDC